MAATSNPVSLETPISIKVSFEGNNKKFKLPLGDLGPNSLPGKLRELLDIPLEKQATFERFSDSASAYITLEPGNVQAYKTLYRAAKAKLKLRLRVTPLNDNNTPQSTMPAPSSQLPVTISGTRSIRQKPSSKTLVNPIFSASEVTLNNPNGGVRVSSASSARQPEIKKESEDEAPVPRPFPAREHFFSELASISRARDLALRTKEPSASAPGCSWSVYCNACDEAMPEEHYHCNICDDGDYDLCASCVASGKHCHGDNHWLIKRSVKNGKVVNSTTERVAAQPKIEVEKKMPGAFADVEEKKLDPVEQKAATRTCNSCVQELTEDKFVTCQTCDDYDLCIPCLAGDKHGHHPGHTFKPAVEGNTVGPLADFLCVAGRNVRHHALCDSCDKTIYGVRHKCLNCPDWDYCTDCITKAPNTHPGHRFVAIYDPLPEPRMHASMHMGIHCDGPLCNKEGPSRTFIRGTRYKCAICHDTDYCANCEASPSNKHNRTHPLIQFKSPVRNVSVTTMGEDRDGSVMATMGDNNVKASPRSSVTPSVSTVSKIQPIVDVKPVEAPAPKSVKEKIEIKDLLAEPIKEKLKVQDLLTAEKSPVAKKAPVNAPSGDQLNAHFVCDTITDGTKMAPNQRFIQIWTLKNPGPYAWPAGCRVRYVGGDNMLNVDENAGSITGAVASNVINRSVEVGDKVHFRVLLKAPQREGTSISYWRLKSPDNIPFGHRLWCHIDVANPIQDPITPAQALEPAAAPAESSKAPSQDKEMFRLLEEFNKKRRLVSEALKVQEERVKEQAEVQKRNQKQMEEEDRAKRVQMLRALHAARLATVASERKEAAANMKIAKVPTWWPPAPTVEDAPEKDEPKAAPVIVSKPEAKSEEQVKWESLKAESVKVKAQLEAFAAQKAAAEEAATARKALEVKAEPEAAKEPELKAEPEVKAAPEVKATPEVKETKPEKSTMIFPKLEKESPSSSTHEAAIPSTPTVVTAAPSVASPATEEPDIFEDAESVEIVDDESSSDDDGFFTDEEYDILDASDEELP